MPFDVESFYMSPEEFYTRIAYRKDFFTKSYTRQDLQSWNYADYKAYQLLTEQIE